MEVGRLALSLAWIALLSIVLCHMGSDVQQTDVTVEEKVNKTEALILSQVQLNTDILHHVGDNSPEAHNADHGNEEETHFQSSTFTIAPATPHMDHVKSSTDSLGASVTLPQSEPFSAHEAATRQFEVDPETVDIIQFDSDIASQTDVMPTGDANLLETCSKDKDGLSDQGNKKDDPPPSSFIADSSIVDQQQSGTSSKETTVEALKINREVFGVEEGPSDAPNVDGDGQLQSYLEWVEQQEKIGKASLRPIVERAPNRKRKLEKTNYASEDCGAKIVATNPGLRKADAVLKENKDEYMLNECAADQWMFVVELCQRLQIESLEVANFELFASSPKNMSIYVSDGMSSEWQFVKEYDIAVDGNIQQFEVDHEVYGKYVKIELKGQLGNEHYCTLSLLRVFGTTEFEMLADEDDIPATGTVEDATVCEGASCAASQLPESPPSLHFLQKAKNVVLSMFGTQSPDDVNLGNETAAVTNGTIQSTTGVASDGSGSSLGASTTTGSSQGVEIPPKEAIVVRYEEEDEEDMPVHNSTQDSEAPLPCVNKIGCDCFNKLSLSFPCYVIDGVKCWMDGNPICRPMLKVPLIIDEVTISENRQSVGHNEWTSDEPPIEMPPVMELTLTSHDTQTSGVGSSASNVKHSSVVTIHDTLADTSIPQDSSAVGLQSSEIDNSGSAMANLTSEEPHSKATVLSSETSVRDTSRDPEHVSSSQTEQTTLHVSLTSSRDPSKIELTSGAPSSASPGTVDSVSVVASGAASSVSVQLQPSFQLVMESSHGSNESSLSRATSHSTHTGPSIAETIATPSISILADSPHVLPGSDAAVIIPSATMLPIVTPSSNAGGHSVISNGNGAGSPLSSVKNAPVLPASKESVLVKLKKKISDLEANLNRSLDYLELMSQTYRKSLEEQQKGAEKKLVNLSNLLANISSNMNRVSALQAKVIEDLQVKLHNMTSTVESMQANTSSLERDMTLMAQSYTFVLLFQVAVLVYVVMRRCCPAALLDSPTPPARRHSEPLDLREQHSTVGHVAASKSDSMICRHVNNNGMAMHARRKRNKKNSKTDDDLMDVVFSARAKQQTYTTSLCAGATALFSSGKHLLLNPLTGASRLFSSGHPVVVRSRLPVSRRSRPLRRFASVDRAGTEEKLSHTLSKRRRSCESIDSKLQHCAQSKGRSI